MGVSQTLTGHFAKVWLRKNAEYQFLTCSRVGSLLRDDFCGNGMEWCFNRWRRRRCGFAPTVVCRLSGTQMCALPYKALHKGLKLSSGCIRKLHCRGRFCIISEQHFFMRANSTKTGNVLFSSLLTVHLKDDIRMSCGFNISILRTIN